MQTTPNLLRILEEIEGFRADAYDDFQPKVPLRPGDEDKVQGTLTIGIGSTRVDGKPVKLGDTITRQKAFDEKRKYIIEQIEPALERLFTVPLTGDQADALAALIYNFGPNALQKWNLTKLINAKAKPSKIAKEWVTDTYYSKGRPMLGLYRRRVVEVLLWFGLDWRAGFNVSWDDDVLDVLEKMGWQKRRLMRLPAPKPKKEAVMGATLTLPDNWGDMTPKEQTEWLNTGQLEGLQERAQAAPVVQRQHVVNVPPQVASAPPKPMEQSMTHRGLSKKEAGKEAMIVGGVMTGVTTTLPAVNSLTGYLEKYSTQTILITGLIIGGLILGVGLWRWWSGRMIAYEGRQRAQEAKI